MQYYWAARSDSRNRTAHDHGVIPGGYIDIVFNLGDQVYASDSGCIFFDSARSFGRDYYNSLPPPVRQNQARALKTLRSLTYVASDDVEARGLRISEPITRISYYKGELGQRIFYFTVWLTQEAKVALLRFNPE